MQSPPNDPFTFSDFWTNPIFIAISVVAGIVTLVWVVWIVGGLIATKPRLRIVPGYGKASEDRKGLFLRFYNDQLASWPFNMLNIKRQGFDEFWILPYLKKAEGEFLFDLWVPLHDRKGTHDEVHSLPASIFPLEGVVAVIDDELTHVMAFWDEGVVRTVLEPDTYEFCMFVHADETLIRPMAQRFVVTVDGAQWVAEPYEMKSRRRFRLIRRLLAFRTAGSWNKSVSARYRGTGTDSHGC